MNKINLLAVFLVIAGVVSAHAQEKVIESNNAVSDRRTASTITGFFDKTTGRWIDLEKLNPKQREEALRRCLEQKRIIISEASSGPVVASAKPVKNPYPAGLECVSSKERGDDLYKVVCYGIISDTSKTYHLVFDHKGLLVRDLTELKRGIDYLMGKGTITQLVYDEILRDQPYCFDHDCNF